MENEMTTIIVSNGSKFAGQENDSIESLLKVLETETLDRSFEAYGNFINENPRYCSQYGGHNHTSEYEGLTAIFGNFHTCSHVFNIKTNDPQIIKNLTNAINKNKKTKSYLAQPKPKNTNHKPKKDCDCIDCLYYKNTENCNVCQSTRAVLVETESQ